MYLVCRNAQPARPRRGGPFSLWEFLEYVVGWLRNQRNNQHGHVRVAWWRVSQKSENKRVRDGDLVISV